MRVMNRDREWYSKDSFIGYCQPWSDFTDSTAKMNVNFQDWIDYDTDLFPNDTRFGWTWNEAVNPATGVRAYNHIAFRNYDGGVPLVSGLPVQVSKLRRFDESFKWSHETESDPNNRFNTLSECYLTRVAGDAATKCFEIGFFLHYPPETLAFMKKDTGMGQWTDHEGRVWTASFHPGPVPYITFYPNGDLMSGFIDKKAALAWIKGKGVITGNEFVNGCAFGFEPLAGEDRARIDFWNPTLS